ncbi:hypothetical protein HR11_05240 [Porphyromonas macacae]|uniref:Uncharacterized conserved protein (Some members contain a von Willebrand factor type A (VWA) domain) n=1 Tax=Porphyromonas macacae TaxID=28115 RepID=A0A0A2G8N3_9PORP|nr:DUF58 domain-containing protein [Porphyromonas macacae]KGN72453.1 hypothetical protein HQ47_09445 [Porphyromonas macacae]KGN99638.1 hypothetical protein HR11_05240 [Porphyromonas macacae]SUB89791.1 Uncharacterized conserved protein (some members contain a von Willebrand factor type A (vWA) domain) [Porphyromonas macacae]
MDTAELLKKVRRIEIKARGLSEQIFAGQYHSAFKGRGMAFSEVRNYQIGDDVRDIDWNVTARYASPHVKVFEEERELTVMIMVDLSGSTLFGTQSETKRELITEIAATLAFSAIQNNDKVGAILFTDKVEKYIPPKSGKKHILYIIRELLEFEPDSKGTDLNHALTFLRQVLKKRCTSFILSDFMQYVPDYQDALTIVSRRHDMIGVRIYDLRERELPRMGLVRLLDAETGQERWIDTASRKIRKIYQENYQSAQSQHANLCKKLGIDSIDVHTGQDYVPQLINLFKKRS